MDTLDRRTRTSAEVRDVDVAAFFAVDLPGLIATRGHLAAPGAAELGVEPFTIVVDGRAHTLALAGDELTVTPGDTGAASVRLTADELAAIVDDLTTPMTLLTGGTLHLERGDLGDFLDWWVVLRSLLDDRPVHVRGAVTFEDRAGAPLDLHRAFTPDDRDDDIAHFVRQAGFLHLRGWLDPDDMATISRDMDAALPTYRPDDGRSWWARTSAGDHRCVRMQGFDAHSPTTARILDGEVVRRIAGLTGDGHRGQRFGSSRVEALVKPIGVVEGISDVPWHKDCSLGMHSYNCSALIIGISVTGADAATGQLRVVAGSHRALVQPAFVRSGLDLPIVDLPTSAGDVTVHCSCTLHMSQPPVTGERRVLYTGLRLPPRDADDTLAERAREIGRVREGAHRTVSQQPGHLVS